MNGNQPQPRLIQTAVALLLTCGLGPAAVAQDAKPLALVPGDNPPSNSHDVYLNDSFEATDAIHRAEALAQRERWRDAADALQNTIDKFGDHLIRVAPGSYVSVRDHIHTMIAAWAPAGVSAYQALFDGVFERERQRLWPRSSLEEAVRLFDRFFCTAGAAELAHEIAERALEAGDLPLAGQVLRRVIEDHPTPGDAIPRYASIITIIETMDGTRNATVPLPPNQAQVRLRWLGQDLTVGEIVADVGRGFTQFREPPPGNDWSLFGGNPQRNRAAHTTVDELGLLWRVDLDSLDQTPPAERTPEEPDEEPRAHARELTVQPVVANGLVFVQRLREIIAIRQATGEVAWRFSAEIGDARDTFYADDQAPGWDAVTVADGRVYAALRGDSAPYYSYDSSRTPHELICLDAETGSVIWRSDRSRADDRFSEIHFDSAPIVHQNSLFVVGRRSRSFGFEDCYLYRFNTTTGEPDYRTHVGSASTGGFGSRPATRSVIAMDDGVVFVNTNLGSIAAVTARTGTVRWLRLHDRRGGTGVRGSGGDLRPWQINPQFVSGGRVITLPNHGSNILLHDAVSGELDQEIPLTLFGNTESLLGVRGDLLCSIGEQVGCYDLNDADFRWIKPLPPDAVLFGRGIWANDRLIAPTRLGLSVYQVADGTRTDMRWDADAEGGNLLALPDQLIVSGARTVSAYVRKTEIWQALRDRMTAAPLDPLPALELAELALRSGEHADALASLREGVRRAGDSGSVPSAAVSTRLFNDACAFAENLSRRKTLTGAELEELFAIAARFPLSAQEHLDYRIRFAQLFETHGEPARALELYQQLLRDRSLRPLPVPGKHGKGLHAAAYAKTHIDAVLAAHDRVLYAPYEDEAASLVANGRAARDASELRRAVDIFPNSDAAPQAMIALGELAMVDGRAGDAARTWSQAYHRYSDRVDPPLLMCRIADAYEKDGRLQVAYRWLTKAAREHPQYTLDVDGTTITLARYRDRLDHVREQVEPSRAKLRLPLDEQFERAFSDAIRLMDARFPNDPRHRRGVCFLHTGGGILAVNPTTGRDHWSKPCTVRAKPDLLLSTEDRAIFATGYQIFAVAAPTGDRLWSVGDYPADFDADNVDWEDGRIIRHRALHGRFLVVVRDDGEVLSLDVENGRRLWSGNFDPKPNRTLRVFDDFIAYGLLHNGRTTVYLLDPLTGDLRHTVETELEETPEHVAITLDGQLVIVTARAVSAIDMETHQRRWSVTFRGQIRSASLLLDLDAVYVSPDGNKLQKLALSDGRILWESDTVGAIGGSDPTVVREGAFLIVSTNRSVQAVDPLTGLTLWTGAIADRPELIARFVTDRYVVAVDHPRDQPDGKTVAYFYDHRNASGVIPTGGAPNLGVLEDIRGVAVFDRSLVIQSGLSLMGITSGAAPAP